MALITILAATAFTYFVSVALGSILLNQLKVVLYREEERPLALIAGSALLSLIVFLLCSIQQFRRGVVLGVGLAAILIAWRTGAFQRAKRTLEPLGCVWQSMLVLTIPFGVVYAVYAAAPEISPDGCSYHLGFVSRYAAARGFVTLRSNMYGYLSQGVELLFLHSFVFGRHSAAALTHLTFLIALARLIVCYGRRIGHPAIGASAALFVFASPVVGIDASTAYIDVATAAIVFAVFYLLQVWDPDRNPGTLAVAGLVAGFCYAAKYTAALMIPYAIGYVLLRTRKVRPALIVVATSVILVAPWVGRNLWITGNPFSPFFNQYFPNPHIYISFEREFSGYLRTYDVPGAIDRIRHATVGGFALSGLTGPIFLLLPVGLLAMRRREARHLLIVALIALAAYPLNVGTRFLIPGLPFLALLLAMGVAALPFRSWILAALILAHAYTSWAFEPFGTLRAYVDPHGWFIGRFPWEAALRIESEDKYMRRWSPSYRWARLMEELVPPGKRVLSGPGVADAYTSREVMVWFQSAQNESLRDILFLGFDPNMQSRRAWRFRLPSTTARKLRVEQTRSLPNQWSVSELRIFDGPNELPRSNDWRITARPFPWTVQRAFDNTDVTRWRSGEPSTPGMYMEVDFGQIRTLSEVLVATSNDNGEAKLALSVSDGSTWRATGVEAQLEERSPGRWTRRAATEELRLRGVDYLFISPDDWGARDIMEAPEEWGLTLLAEEGGARLYRIEPLPKPSLSQGPSK